MSNPAISSEVLTVFAERSRRDYINLPYHNYGDHVLSAIGYFHEICDEIEPKGVEIDRSLGVAALYGHDRNYHLDYEAAGYESREAWAAELSRDDLLDLGVDEEPAEQVHSAVLATHFDAEPKTNLELAVRIADVGNVFGDYPEFVRNFVLFQLDCMRVKIPVHENFREQVRKNIAFLGYYVTPEPVFIAVDGTEVPLEFGQNKVQKNFARLSRASVVSIGKITGLDISGLPKTWLQ